MQISPHFTLKEATKTSKPFPNIPNDEELATIQRTAMKMERVREFLGRPIVPSSWFRSEAVNSAVGGVKASQHRVGEAVDFNVPGLDYREVIQLLKPKMAELEIDQLILEPGWVHISFCTSRANRDRAPRNQFLDLTK